MLNALQNPSIGVRELREELTQLLGRIQEEGADVVVTQQQGKPTTASMGVEKCLEFQDSIRDLSDPQSAEKLAAARREIDEGQGASAE